MSLSREEAFALLNQYVKNERMINHCLASEAVMRALARKLGRDEEKWGIAGLLHDLDVEIVNADLAVHGLEAEKILKEKNVDPEIIDAIKMHNETAAGAPRSTEFQHALAAGETITGLIVAVALVYPDKRLKSVKPSSVAKRMKEAHFARTVNREHIMLCERLGLSLPEFIEVSLAAMAAIDRELGLA